MKNPTTNSVAQKGVGSIANTAKGLGSNAAKSAKMTPGSGKIGKLDGYSYMPNQGIKKLKDSANSSD